MPYQVFFTKQADADLDNLLDYIAQYSPKNAISFVDKLQQRIETVLNITPYGGSPCGDFHYFSFENYVVVYDIDKMNKSVYVHMITEGHRQWKIIFSERE